MIDREHFFNEVRRPIFAGSIPQSAVDNIEVIFAEWERRSLPDLRWLAYMLATVLGECGSNFAPVREGFKTTDKAARAYVRKHYGSKYGKPAGPYGQYYYGRGLVQLTWLTNYDKAGKKIGLDLVQFPDKVLEPAIATRILFDGMIEGWFTGKSLGDYIKGAKCDYLNARRIINGTDKAKTFAGWAHVFRIALRTVPDLAEPAPEAPKPVPPVNPPAQPKPAPEPPDAPSQGMSKGMGILIAAVTASFAAAATWWNEFWAWLGF